MPTTTELQLQRKNNKFLILLPLRTIYFQTFQCETPCTYLHMYVSCLVTLQIIKFFFSLCKFEIACITLASVKPKSQGNIRPVTKRCTLCYYLCNYAICVSYQKSRKNLISQSNYVLFWGPIDFRGKFRFDLTRLWDEAVSK